MDIFPPHRKYLSFSWRFSNSQIRYFQFNVLPFGLSSACYVFTKLLGPLVKCWCGFGYSSVVSLDDCITGRRSCHLAMRTSNQVRQDLKSCGLTANEKKCMWFPMQIGEWLGMIINTISMTFVVPQKKLEKNLVLSGQHLIQVTFPSHSQRIGMHCGANHIYGIGSWACFSPNDDEHV